MSLDYKVRIEGRQGGLPTAVNMFSIDGRIRAIKGRYLYSDVNLYLEFDEDNEKLVRVYGQQFGSETDLRFSYTKEKKITRIEGKKGTERTDIRVGYVGNEYFHLMNLKTGSHFEAHNNEKGELKLIRQIPFKIRFLRMKHPQ